MLILAGFILTQANVLDADSHLYLILNLAGATILAVLAFQAQRWGFVLLEGVWAFVALAGLILRLSGKEKPDRHALGVCGLPDVPKHRTQTAVTLCGGGESAHLAQRYRYRRPLNGNSNNVKYNLDLLANLHMMVLGCRPPAGGRIGIPACSAGRRRSWNREKSGG